MTGRSAKRKAYKRFEQMNHIVDRVLRRIPTQHAAAMFVCFRHGREGGRFRISNKRLGETLGVHKRTAQRLLDDLEQWGAIKVVEPERGTIPKTFTITGEVARGDSHAAPSKGPSTHRSDDKLVP